MGKNVRILAQLQEIDLKIDSSRGETQALQGEIHSLEAQAEEKQLEIAQQKSELCAVEEEKQVLEENLATESDSIVRSEERLREIKTQKEYQAVSKEIAAAKKVKADLEDQILQKITRSDELNAIIAEKEGNLQEFQVNSSERSAELQSRIDQLEADISKVSAARDETAKAVAPSMMKRYETLREKRQGVAIAEAKGGSCLGCNMNLPPQLFNSLFKEDTYVTCPHCQRLLYMRNDAGDVAE
ncbi:MAG: C4-type zinc ribbon domain-containing protein [Geobacteraceae bacterium]